MSRRRYFEEQRSGNGAIYHCVKTEIEPGDKIRLFNLMNKVKSDVYAGAGGDGTVLIRGKRYKS